MSFPSAHRHKRLLARVLAEVVSEELRALRDNRSLITWLNGSNSKLIEGSVKSCFPIVPEMISIGACFTT